MIRFITDRLVTLQHAQSVLPNAVVIIHLADLSSCHGCNTDSMDLQGMYSEW